MKRAFLFAATLLFGTVSLNSSVAADSLISRFNIGQEFDRHIKVNRKIIPLPPGKWVITGLSESLNNTNTMTGTIILSQISNARGKYVQIVTNEDVARSGWARVTSCSRNDTHHRETAADNQGRDQQCWWVNHFTTALGANPNAADVQHLTHSWRIILASSLRRMERYEFGKLPQNFDVDVVRVLSEQLLSPISDDEVGASRSPQRPRFVEVGPCPVHPIGEESLRAARQQLVSLFFGEIEMAC